MFIRHAEGQLLDALRTKTKVLTLFGPRQVGKTTLMRGIADQLEGRKLILNGDYLDDRARLRPERAPLADLLAGLDFLFVDEAQNVPDIGLALKLIHDEFPAVRVMATGSSSFDLRERTGEPLTGRQISFLLYPISYGELAPSPIEREIRRQHGMVYGGYPETLLCDSPSEKVEYLRQLTADYLLRDIHAQIDLNRSKLTDLLRLLAFQIGSEVSLNELGRSVQVDTKTVARYLDVLERAFVIRRLGGFSRNLRKEVSKSRKVYFLDLGIRNAIIQAFDPLPLRNDIGPLWENYLMIERIKRNAYAGHHPNYFFWRTYDRQEIDLIEESAGRLAAFEFKSGEGSRRKGFPRLWSETYPESSTEIVTPDSSHLFLDPPS